MNIIDLFKTKKLFLFSIFLFFIFGCSKVEYDFNHYVNNIVIPKSYSVDQSGLNSGFAGVDDTGEYAYNTSYEVDNKKIIDEIQDEYRFYTITELKNLISGFSFEKTGIKIDDDEICFLNEQWGVSIGFICFKKNTPYYFQLKEFKGNHQSKELLWKLSDYNLNENNYCLDEKNVFCDVFYNALIIDPTVCNRVTVSKDYCKKVMLDIGN